MRRAVRVAARRFRVGYYRILYQLLDNELVIVAVAIGHRKDIHES
ncbi:MAG TPA: hypothetical protein DIC34_18425 [Treponema sp.]|nr:hypothetical protein [Treponema sp.]